MEDDLRESERISRPNFLPDSLSRIFWRRRHLSTQIRSKTDVRPTFHLTSASPRYEDVMYGTNHNSPIGRCSADHIISLFIVRAAFPVSSIYH